jgi:hypothetical protein
VQGKSTEKELKIARGEIETSYFLRTGDSTYTLVTLAMGFARVESTHFSWNILFDCDIRGFYLASRALGLNTHLSRCEFTAVLSSSSVG